MEPDRSFHRSYCLLHSRTVEYPYAIKRIGTDRESRSRVFLDVGTAGADPLWIRWLGELMLPHATDIRTPGQDLGVVEFHLADIREFFVPAAVFDCVTAISVIEHIGLPDDRHGDRRAIEEITRLLVPGGKLIMTVPFGKRAGRCKLNDTTRVYDYNHLMLLTTGLLKPTDLEYYEYQHIGRREKYNPRRLSLSRRWRKLTGEYGAEIPVPDWDAGEVTWRQIPIHEARATNRHEIDGVICGTWEKPGGHDE